MCDWLSVFAGLLLWQLILIARKREAHNTFEVVVKQSDNDSYWHRAAQETKAAVSLVELGTNAFNNAKEGQVHRQTFTELDSFCGRGDNETLPSRPTFINYTTHVLPRRTM